LTIDRGLIEKLPLNSVEKIILQLKVPSMDCSACGDTITNAVMVIDSSATVHTDPKNKQVNIQTQAFETAIKNAVEAAGYPVA
jgi:copper chaperone